MASSATSSSAVVQLEGRNVFSKNAGFDASLIAMEDAVLVRTASDYELACGGTSYNYYDRTGKFNQLSANIPALSESYSIAEAGNTQKYIFVMGESSISELWSADEKPEKPFKLPSEKKPGVYKYSWNKTTSEDGTVVLTAGRVADFPIKVNMTYDINLCFNVYIPGFLVEEGYLDYKAVTIDRESYPRTDWEKVVIDGTEYYKAMSGFIDEDNADKEIEVFIPFDYDSKTRVETTYVLDLQKYLDRVIATEEENVYTEEEYDLVYEIKGTYLPSADIPVGAEQSLYVKTSDDSEWVLSEDGTHTVISGITWEPGYIALSMFRVNNSAPVPASVIFDIVSSSEISSLADVIDVFVAEGVEDYPTDRESVNEWTNIGTLADIASSGTVISDTVDAGGEKTYVIAFMMQTTAGNEYQGIELCDFDIEVTFGSSES
jgi:hypothetical protein